ncbi:MAG: hypothetical protein U1F77_04475 [Kiritimatiellia bacterium]
MKWLVLAWMLLLTSCSSPCKNCMNDSSKSKNSCDLDPLSHLRRAVLSVILQKDNKDTAEKLQSISESEYRCWLNTKSQLPFEFQAEKAYIWYETREILLEFLEKCPDHKYTMEVQGAILHIDCLLSFSVLPSEWTPKNRPWSADFDWFEKDREKPPAGEERGP